MTLLRHLLSIALLPFVVVVLVPRWLLGSSIGDGATLPPMLTPAGLARLAGVVLLLAGLGLFAWCVVLFARVGRGTLAPWDPTQRLVAMGPYQYVRNPMISGVAAMLAGEALLFQSPRLAGWLALFVLINHLYFLTVEEPGLDRRFGAAYARYRAHVPRWVPRVRPWRDEASGSDIAC